MIATTLMDSKEKKMGIPPTNITAPATLSTAAVKHCTSGDDAPYLTSTTSSSNRVSLSSTTRSTPTESSSNSRLMYKDNVRERISPITSTKSNFDIDRISTFWDKEQQPPENKEKITAEFVRTGSSITSKKFDEDVNKCLAIKDSSSSCTRQEEKSNVDEDELFFEKKNKGCVTKDRCLSSPAMKLSTDKDTNDQKMLREGSNHLHTFQKDENSKMNTKRSFSSSLSSFSNSESNSNCLSTSSHTPYFHKKPRSQLVNNNKWDHDYQDPYTQSQHYQQGRGEDGSMGTQLQKRTDVTSDDVANEDIVVPPLPSTLNTISTGLSSQAPPLQESYIEDYSRGMRMQENPGNTVRRNEDLCHQATATFHEKDHQQYYHNSTTHTTGAARVSSTLPSRSLAGHRYDPARGYIKNHSSNKRNPTMHYPSLSTASQSKFAEEAAPFRRVPQNQDRQGERNTGGNNARSKHSADTHCTGGNTFESSFVLSNHQSDNELSKYPQAKGRMGGGERPHYYYGGGYADTTGTTLTPHHHFYHSATHGSIPYHDGISNSNRGVIKGNDPTSRIAPPKLAPYYQRRIVPLSTEDDENWLSEFLCFVRSHCAEVFVATNEDVASRMNSKKVLLDQVGVRCRFCAHLPHRERAGRSSSFPSSLSRIYQSLTMMLRDHFTKCPAMPDHIKHRYMCLKANASQGATDSKRYWVESAKSLGLIDTNEGIRYDR